MDKKEAQYIDAWPTAEHMRKGRISVPKELYKQKKVDLKKHLERLRPNYKQKPDVDTKQHKPKEKKFETVDKTNLKEL